MWVFAFLYDSHHEQGGGDQVATLFVIYYFFLHYWRHAENLSVVCVSRNIVSTVNLDCKLDLKAIALQARNAEYNPKACDMSIDKLYLSDDELWKFSATPYSFIYLFLW